MLKTETVKEFMRREIQSMQPNERIISRQALCRKFGFARATIDAAISELIEEGVLYAITGSGTYVSEAYRTNAYAMGEGIVSWGVILPDMVKDVYPMFIRGIEDYSRKYNINVVVCNTDHDITKQNLYAVRLLESGIAGLILIPAIATERDISGLLQLQQKNIPIVFCNRAEDSLHDAPLVCSNDFYGGYIATRHLIEKGYKRIAYVSRTRYKTSLDRYFGYTSALLEQNMEIYQKHVLLESAGGSINEGLYSQALELLKESDAPDAFFCFNDECALSVYRAVRDCGKQVSTDVGLIGYDNSAICEAVDIPITSVHFRSYDMGRKAAEILDNALHGKHLKGNRVYVFQPELVIRQSCLGKGVE